MESGRRRFEHCRIDGTGWNDRRAMMSEAQWAQLIEDAPCLPVFDVERIRISKLDPTQIQLWKWLVESVQKKIWPEEDVRTDHINARGWSPIAWLVWAVGMACVNATTQQFHVTLMGDDTSVMRNCEFAIEEIARTRAEDAERWLNLHRQLPKQRVYWEGELENDSQSVGYNFEPGSMVFFPRGLLTKKIGETKRPQQLDLAQMVHGEELATETCRQFVKWIGVSPA
eukprot:GABV01001152.1.p2 GENE.GABV01001152.1~~GABV01001152.1.p2  ORF type:complete len:227 (+),score=36.64 GABV01001152.1:249-929(+)